MRSDLEEIARIDQYLFRQLNPDELRQFEAQLIIDGELAEKVEAQRLAHRLVHLYSRNQERSRMEGIYRLLSNEPAFANQLTTIFS